MSERPWTQAQMMRTLKPRAPRHPVRLAEIAFKELLLSTDTWTQADRDRLGRMWRGMRWLDDDQAGLRLAIEALLGGYDKVKSTTMLVRGLRALVASSPGKPETKETR
jgi:hypothetical protein